MDYFRKRGDPNFRTQCKPIRLHLSFILNELYVSRRLHYMQILPILIMLWPIRLWICHNSALNIKKYYLIVNFRIVDSNFLNINFTTKYLICEFYPYFTLLTFFFAPLGFVWTKKKVLFHFPLSLPFREIHCVKTLGSVYIHQEITSIVVKYPFHRINSQTTVDIPTLPYKSAQMALTNYLINVQINPRWTNLIKSNKFSSEKLPNSIIYFQ